MGLLSPSISTQFVHRKHSRLLATNRRALALRLVDSVIGCVLATFLLSFLWFGFNAQGTAYDFQGLTSSHVAAAEEPSDSQEIKHTGSPTKIGPRIAVAGPKTR